MNHRALPLPSNDFTAVLEPRTLSAMETRLLVLCREILANPGLGADERGRLPFTRLGAIGIADQQGVRGVATILSTPGAIN